MKHAIRWGLLTFSVYFSAVGATAATKENSRSAKNTNREALMAELTGKDVARMSDANIYAEIVGAYQVNNAIVLKNHLQSLLKRYPQSEYADNALYLAGRNAMEQRNYAEALKYFSQVIEKYPNGNKVASAQFAKAKTYQKMNLGPMAVQVLSSVQKKYPGSPESFRAESELKLIK